MVALLEGELKTRGRKYSLKGSCTCLIHKGREPLKSLSEKQWERYRHFSTLKRKECSQFPPSSAAKIREITNKCDKCICLNKVLLENTNNQNVTYIYILHEFLLLKSISWKRNPLFRKDERTLMFEHVLIFRKHNSFSHSNFSEFKTLIQFF